MQQRRNQADDGGFAGRLPMELTRSAPRPVRLTVQGKVVAGVAALLTVGALVGGAFLFEQAQRDRARLERLRREAVTTDAEVIQTRLVKRGQEQRRLVVYQYRVGERLYQGRFTLRRGSAKGIEPGSRLRVAYLPEDPSQSWPVGREPAGLPVWAALVIPLAVWSSAPLIFWILRRQRRLLSEGRAVVGTVTRVESVPGRYGYRRVHYEFPLPSGARGSGFFDQRSRDLVPEGTPVVVVYDPENPRRNARYPFALVRAETRIG